jgi:hypothetical protein
MLARLTGQGFEWDVYEILRPILGNEFAGFEQERLDGEETILRLSVPRSWTCDRGAYACSWTMWR